jgi:hypothetical protein
MSPLKSKIKARAKTPPVVEAPAMVSPPAPATVAPPAPAASSDPAPVVPPAPATPAPTPSPAILDPDLAELRAFRVRYRAGDFPEPDIEVKRRVRAELVAKGISLKWSSLIARFGFEGEIALAMLRTLESPGRCHAGWFKEGEIAVKRAGVDLSTLTYPVIKAAIDQWRAERTTAKATASE